jgi:hypothetical protein
MSILYFVTDIKGEHIMTAPLQTLRDIYDLDQYTLQRIVGETLKLEDICTVVASFGFCDVELHIRRLPIEIPVEGQP